MNHEPVPQVYVVDDDISVREALSSLIRSAGLSVRTFASASESLGGLKKERPGCLVLDIQLPDINGFELQQRLATDDIQIPIIFLTGHGDIPMSVRAIKAGAVEFLTKPFRDQDLVDAIQHGIEKHRAARQESVKLAEFRALYDSLTPREREVFPLVAAGLLNKQIAARLGTGEKTIKVHRGQVMHKMKAESLAHLIRIGEKLGLSSPKS